MKKNIFLIMAGILFVLSTNAYAALTDGLVAYYPFNNNANDESSGDNDGTVQGATLVADRFGNPNRAYSFDRSNIDKITIGDVELVTGNTLSVQAWFKTTDPLGSPSGFDWDRPIVSKLYNNVAYYLGGSVTVEDKIEFAVGSSNYRATSDSTLNDGIWHHIVGVYDGSLVSDNIKLYVDSVLQATTYNYSGNLVDTPELLTIGANQDENGYTGNDAFSGAIDEVAIWNRALNQTEVSQLYIPEPATLLLLGLGSLMLRRKS